ncbi:DUF4179 domain-containing protein [Bacillus sp. Hm123]|uniref:DUF4179 domain-containing protein n=1 Tax=Bacillus sp. Hm123 TaxID=3450745 RepID=UPI003F42F62B
MKNPYDLLNETQINVDEYEEVELSQAEKDRLLHRLQTSIQPRKKKPRKGLIAAAVALVMVGPVMLSNEHVWASLSKAGNQIEQFFNKPDQQLTEYKQTSGQVATDQNIAVTLNEVLLDDGQLLMNLNINAEQLDMKALKMNEDLPIFPKGLTLQIGDVTFNDSAGSATYSSELDDKNDNNWNLLYSVDFSGIDTDGDGFNDKDNSEVLDKIMNANQDHDIQIAFNAMQYGKKGGLFSDDVSFEQIKGNWAFQTTVNAQKMKSDTNIYPINKEIHVKEENVEGILNIKEVRVSPVSLKIHYTFKYTKGNEMDNFIDLQIEGEQGKVLDGSSTGDGTDALSKMIKEIPLEGNIEKIKITPDLFGTENDASQLLTDNAFEVEL